MSTKIHLATDPGQRPLSLLLAAGQAGDAPQFQPVPDAIRVADRAGRPRTRPARVLADKDHGSRANRAYLRRRGIHATIQTARELIAGKRGPTRLGSALLLKFYTRAGRFPRGRSDLPAEAVAFVDRQVDEQRGDPGFYEWFTPTDVLSGIVLPSTSRTQQ
ncbi:transposase [Cryptosporangium arvum]|uniref:transposase n=1 Tax=Cryptosporangium arvum TaxID=80871 RepID=UPI0004B74E70|nr:transposase [Cryptosporangium arvum]